MYILIILWFQSEASGQRSQNEAILFKFSLKEFSNLVNKKYFKITIAFSIIDWSQYLLFYLKKMKRNYT